MREGYLTLYFEIYGYIKSIKISTIFDIIQIWRLVIELKIFGREGYSIAAVVKGLGLMVC